MFTFFRCIKNVGHNESIEKVFIHHYTNIKFNMGIHVALNADRKAETYQKLKHVLTNGKQTNFQNDRSIKHQCRGKCSDCHPVYQPSDYLKDAIKPYDFGGLKRAQYTLTGVNLCAHEHPNKPDQTHVELFFRNPSEPQQRIVINIHLNFTRRAIDPAYQHHQTLKHLLAATSSTASIATMLGKACQRGLEQLSAQHKKLDQLNEANHRQHGFYEPKKPQQQTTRRFGFFNKPANHGAQPTTPSRRCAM